MSNWGIAAVSVGMLALATACGNAHERQTETSDVDEVGPASDVLEGKADTAAGNVELKFYIPPAQIEDAFEWFKLDPNDSSERHVYFYDTSTLKLYAGGVVLRARKFIDAPDDSTVKLRNLESSDVDPDWFDFDGFKCEEDRSPTASVSSCSLSWRQDQNEIDAVADGDRDLTQLYSSEQEQFLIDEAVFQPSWETLEVLGPAETLVWSVRSRKLGRKLTIEYWSLGGEKEIFEISTRTTESMADQVVQDVAEYLQSKGFDTNAAGDGKTKAALQYFAGK